MRVGVENTVTTSKQAAAGSSCGQQLIGGLLADSTAINVLSTPTTERDTAD